jgi:hypothetical protein
VQFNGCTQVNLLFLNSLIQGTPVRGQQKMVLMRNLHPTHESNQSRTPHSIQFNGHFFGRIRFPISKVNIGGWLKQQGETPATAEYSKIKTVAEFPVSSGSTASEPIRFSATDGVLVPLMSPGGVKNGEGEREAGTTMENKTRNN